MKYSFSLAFIFTFSLTNGQAEGKNSTISHFADSASILNSDIMDIKSVQDSFVISTFHGVPSTPSPSYQRFLENTKLANFTHFETTFTSSAGNLEALRIAEGLGLKVIVQDYARFGGFQNYPAQIANTTKASVAEAKAMYGKYRSFAGYYIWDEPFLEQLPQVGKDLGLLRQADPDKLFVVTTLQSYSPTYTWENGLYAIYMDSLLSTVQPPILITDYYVFEEDIDKGVKLEDSKLWKDWGFIRKRAAEEGIPFWLYIQLMGDIRGNSPGNMTVPKVAFQNYSALAFGAKGISYYNTIHGIIDHEGIPNHLFEGVKELNRETAVIGNKLLHTLSERIYSTMRLLHGDYMDTLSDSDIVQKAPEGLLIGEFRKMADGGKYVLVVNTDYEQPHSGAIQLNQAKDVFLIDKENGKERAIAPGARVVYYDLLPGRGALYLLK
ncbi:hypothetical protein [Sphingobacterium sp. SYP-B4668]|uniref:hypothetical protein n=1 Tax=Sphingobacterium sp. SYP-B4668 TaxID=2996035 RepID=UPI0022DE186D|nr:hypothetical protein [Sphingobacterium sp. SYP-B4668]